MYKEILSPGKKLRKIRKDFKIRQHEITGGEITRELISIIENDKCNLTSNVAEILVYNINRICKERGIEFKLTTEYLLEDISSQTNKIADEFLNNLTVSENDLTVDVSEQIKAIDLFLMEYEVPEKRALLFEKIGDILKKQKKYNKSFTYYVKAYENLYRIEDEEYLFNLLQKLGNVCIWLTRYKECLYFNELAITHSKNISEELKFKVLFNNALCYIKLKQYDNALQEVENMERMSEKLSKDKIFKFKALKANCFRMNNYFNDALDLNKKLFNEIDEDEIENKLLVLNNILEIYTELNDKKNIKKYLEKIKTIVEKREEFDYCCEIYKQIASSYNLIGDKQSSQDYYKRAIKACKKFKNKEVVEEVLKEILEIVVEEDNIEELNEIKNEALELITLELLDKNSVIILSMISYFNNIGDNDTISSLLGFILER